MVLIMLYYCLSHLSCPGHSLSTPLRLHGLSPHQSMDHPRKENGQLLPIGSPIRRQIYGWRNKEGRVLDRTIELILQLLSLVIPYV